MTGSDAIQPAEQAVWRWLDEVVIGLNLCPFAAGPRRKGLVRVVACPARDEETLAEALLAELRRLDETPPSELETTLIAVTALLAEFEDYRRFVDFAEVLLLQYGWQGIYQLASFHPHYRFADSAPDDPGNLTNRAPLPLLHLIREESLGRILARFRDPESIPEANIRRVSALDEDERRRLFPYLFGP